MLKNFFKILFYSLGFVAVGVIVALLFFKVIDFKKTVSVPSLIGKNILEASRLLSDMGLSLEVVGEEYNDKISRGAIIQQDVSEDQKVEKGSSIRVYVSKGKTEFTIPYLEGMVMSDVELTLLTSGLEIGKVTRVHSDTIEKGAVMAQRPLSGTSTERKVNLLVSLGPYEMSYKCPSFVRMPIEDARQIADGLGIKLIEQASGNVVVSQDTVAGSIIKKGDSVGVTLGRKRGFWF